MELTILMPCLNEAETLKICIDKARTFLDNHHIQGEVLIADNGSTDGSQDIAIQAGARVIAVNQRGYGAALAGGIAAAHGKYIIMGDADNSYDFSALSGILESLRSGNELVMGNRFQGGIAKGAMPFLHRWLGNPVLSFLGRLFYRIPIGDFHCGLGMEFASEMVVKSALHNLSFAEVPVTLSPDGRSRPPHLRTWRDGWRHLRFLLIHSPRWLFLLPGIVLFAGGILAMSAIAAGPVAIAGFGLDIHTMAYAGAAIILGFQMLLLSIFTRMMGMKSGWLPVNKYYQRWTSYLTLENCLIVSSFLILIGITISVHALQLWGDVNFGSLNPRQIMRWVVPSVTIISLAGEVILAGFFFEILKISR